MKVALVNTYDTKGGAARAAFRINEALFQNGVDSSLLVEVKSSQNANVYGSKSRFKNLIKHASAKLIITLLNSGRASLESIALFDSNWPFKLNNSDYDLIHLNWINAEMMSIEDISRIKKPIVWTIHDMWPFCGSSHYDFENEWFSGYVGRRHPLIQSWMRNRKAKHWNKPIQIVCPSTWLSQQVRDSPLMKTWPVNVIPNAIDTEFWKPVDKFQAREKLRLNARSKIIMFGAIGSLSNHIKGFDLLVETLRCLIQTENMKDIELLIVGGKNNTLLDDLSIPSHFTGHLDDDEMMRLCYCAADVVVVPSRLEAFGQVASEAQACGTSVAAFATSGLLDVVSHMETGYLAKSYDPEDLASGIKLLLENEEKHLLAVSGDSKLKLPLAHFGLSPFGQNARARIEELFSYPVVAKKYTDLYEVVLSKDESD